jgi:hypothetical protein
MDYLKLLFCLEGGKAVIFNIVNLRKSNMFGNYGSWFLLRQWCYVCILPSCRKCSFGEGAIHKKIGTHSNAIWPFSIQLVFCLDDLRYIADIQKTHTRYFNYLIFITYLLKICCKSM